MLEGLLIGLTTALSIQNLLMVIAGCLIGTFIGMLPGLGPMSIIAMFLQLPFLYFIGWVVHPIFLILPTSAPTVLMQGAYAPLAALEWVYAIGYTAPLLVTDLTH